MRLTAKLNNVVAVEGKDAIFKCTITPADVNVKWFRNSIPIVAGPKYKIEQGGTTHSLTVTAVTQKDAGEISVDAEGKACSATLQVQRMSRPKQHEYNTWVGGKLMGFDMGLTSTAIFSLLFQRFL